MVYENIPICNSHLKNTLAKLIYTKNNKAREAIIMETLFLIPFYESRAEMACMAIITGEVVVKTPCGY